MGVAEKATAAGASVKDNVFAMFGGGPKKEKKEEEDVDEPSGSSKAKTAEDDDKAPEEEADVHFEPVVHLTEKVDTKTNELEECTFKIGRSCSNLIVRAASGRSAALAMSDCSSIARTARPDLSCVVTRHSRSAPTTMSYQT